MDTEQWLSIMEFPVEWKDSELLIEEFIQRGIREYVPGNERGAEHYRHGFFQWWIKRNPTKETLLKLIELSWIDPDQLMASYVRQCIMEKFTIDEKLKSALHL